MNFQITMSTAEVARTVSQLDDIDLADFLNQLSRRLFQTSEDEPSYQRRVSDIGHALNSYGRQFVDEMSETE